MTTTDTSGEAVAEDTNRPAEGESVQTGGPGPGEYPSGASDLASTGVSSRLGLVLAIGVLLLIGGGLLLTITHSRRSRKL
jgi:LPXTG-motif cell wall-anchored protein